MTAWTTAIDVPAAGVRLDADVVIPHDARAMVLVGLADPAHAGAGRVVAEALQARHEASVLLDLRTGDQPAGPGTTGGGRPGPGTGELADRLVGAVDWFIDRHELRGLPLGLLAVGAATPAALTAAAARAGTVRAVACVGGRADLAGPAVTQVAAPTLLLVGEHDDAVREANQEARNTMTTHAELRIVAGATDLPAEPAALLQVIDAVGGWFDDHLR